MAFTSFDAPGSIYTRGGDINNYGTIIGYFSEAAGNPHGYVYCGGVFTRIDEPDATAGALAGAINDAGTIVGRCPTTLAACGSLCAAVGIYKHGSDGRLKTALSE